jgi:hypothetical protein
MVISFQKNFGGNTPAFPPDIRTVYVEIPCTPASDNGLYIRPVPQASATAPIIYRVTAL